MSSVTRRAFGAASDITKRAVAIHVNPRPWNISEGRAVLRVLQQYGDVIFLRNLQYDYPSPAPNMMIALFRKEQSVQKILNSSPINYSLDPIIEDNSQPRVTESTEEVDMDASEYNENNPTSTPAEDPFRKVATGSSLPKSRFTTPAARRTPFPFEAPRTLKPAEGAPLREFVLKVDNLKMNLQDNVERQPYWNTFKIQRSLEQQDLASSVPLLGLSDLTFRHSTTLEQRVKETNAVRSRTTLRQVWNRANVKSTT